MELLEGVGGVRGGGVEQYPKELDDISKAKLDELAPLWWVSAGIFLTFVFNLTKGGRTKPQ